MVVDIENKKPEVDVRIILKFYEDVPRPYTWGSDSIVYELLYYPDSKKIVVWEKGAFGDSTVVAILKVESIMDIWDICNKTYKEFKEVIKNGEEAD